MAGSPLGSNALIRPSAKNGAIFPLAFFEGWFLAYRLKSEHFCMRYDPTAALY